MGFSLFKLWFFFVDVCFLDGYGVVLRGAPQACRTGSSAFPSPWTCSNILPENPFRSPLLPPNPPPRFAQSVYNRFFFRCTQVVNTHFFRRYGDSRSPKVSPQIRVFKKSRQVSSLSPTQYIVASSPYSTVLLCGSLVGPRDLPRIFFNSPQPPFS